MAPSSGRAVRLFAAIVVLAACACTVSATVSAYSTVSRYQTSTTCGGAPDSVTYTWTTNCTTATCATTSPVGKTTRACSSTVAVPANATYVHIAKSFNVTALTCGGYAASNVMLRVGKCVALTGSTSHVAYGDAKGMEYKTCATVNCASPCTSIFSSTGYCNNGTKLTFHFYDAPTSDSATTAPLSIGTVVAIVSAMFAALMVGLA